MFFSPTLIAIIGAVLAEIGGVLGSVSGCLATGKSGAVAISEDIGQFRNVLILAAAPLTQTFYAMIVLVIVFSAVVPKIASADNSVAWGVFGLCVLTGIAEFVSAYFQGLVCTAGISLLAKTKGTVFTGTILMAAYLELLGIVGMVFAVMSFSLLKLM
jgi:V/A-type H+/Na+-transporting ATPase subunit K